MGIVEYIREFRRPKLPVDPEILERELRLGEFGSNRVQWVLNNSYLTEGGLDELREHPDFDFRRQGMDYSIAYFASQNHGLKQSKIVGVRIPASEDPDFISFALRASLKIDLHNRGCNAGVFYKTYKKDNFWYAQAVPATLSGE